MRRSIALMSALIMIVFGLAITTPAEADVAPRLDAYDAHPFRGQPMQFIVRGQPGTSYTISSNLAPSVVYTPVFHGPTAVVMIPGDVTASSIEFWVTVTGETTKYDQQSFDFVLPSLEPPTGAPWHSQMAVHGFAQGEIVKFTYSADVGGPASVLMPTGPFASSDVDFSVSLAQKTLSDVTVTATGQTYGRVATQNFRTTPSVLTAGMTLPDPVLPYILMASDPPGATLNFGLNTGGFYYDTLMTHLWSGTSQPTPAYTDLGENWRSGYAFATLAMQTDGNLVLYHSGYPSWSTGTDGSSPDNHVIIQSDGNLVLYMSDGYPLWSSLTGPLPPRAALLAQGETVSLGQTIKTTNGNTFAMQTDGNLVLYNKQSRPLWSTNTRGSGNRVTMQTDGNLVLYDAQSHPLWNTNTITGAGNRMIVQPDGNLVVYTPSGEAVWASNTHT